MTFFEELVHDCLEYMTPEELADYMGVSVPTIKRWASGKNLPYKHARYAGEQKMLRHPIWDEPV